MATTPQPPPAPKPAPPPPPASPAPPVHPTPPPADKKPEDGKEAADKKPEEKKEPPDLDPEQALALFRNGDHIVKKGDKPDKWIAMGRTGDGAAVLMVPLTDETLKAIKDGKYYLSK